MLKLLTSYLKYFGVRLNVCKNSKNIQEIENGFILFIQIEVAPPPTLFMKTIKMRDAWGLLLAACC